MLLKRKQSQLFREKYESTEINEHGFIFKHSLKDHSWTIEATLENIWFEKLQK